MQDLMWQESLEYLQQQQIEILPWPSKSLNLKPKRTSLDELECCLRSRQQALRNLQELSDVLLKELNNIPLYKIRRIIASMRKQCQAVMPREATLDIEGK